MPVTRTRDPLFFMNVGQSILDSAVDALECYELDVPDRLFVGFDEPPQDCCPELICWLGDVRTWDGNLTGNGNLQQHIGYQFDCTIRIGRCYVDVDEKGEPIDSAILADWNQLLYADMTALYIGWVGQWQAGNVTELSNCDVVSLGTMTQYNEGGCAGSQFTITVGVF